jgi:hypothetical protein
MPGRKKRSISMPPEVDAAIAAAAEQAGLSYSAWLADQLRPRRPAANCRRRRRRLEIDHP